MHGYWLKYVKGPGIIDAPGPVMLAVFDQAIVVGEVTPPQTRYGFACTRQSLSIGVYVLQVDHPPRRDFHSVRIDQDQNSRSAISINEHGQS